MSCKRAKDWSEEEKKGAKELTEKEVYIGTDGGREVENACERAHKGNGRER